jgi:drug/metabolite transporter (DMT)-like permease
MNSGTEKSKPYGLKFIILIILPIIFWSCAFPFIKMLLEELTFINLTIMRFVVVCLSLLIVIPLQRKRINPLKKKDIIPIFLLGFFGIIGYHLGLNYGEQFVSAGAASLIIATIPVLVVILSILYLKEKITIKQTIGILLSLSGVVIISLLGSRDAKIEIGYIFGALAVFFAALMGAFYTIAGKKMLKNYSAFSLTIYAMLLGSIGLIPFFNIGLIDQVINLSITAWASLIFLGLFSTIIAYTLWYIALETRDATEISPYLYAIPVVSTFISYFLVDERITLFFILGGFLVIAGLVLVNSKKRPKNRLLLR